MISLYRRLPSYFALENIRTFCALILNGEEIGSFRDGELKSKGLYRLLEFNNKNVRVLLISNSAKNEKMHCSMRCNAGAINDADIPGIAHLLEHVIVSSIGLAIQAETHYRDTVYAFVDDEKDFWRSFEKLSKVMFSPEPLATLCDKFEEHVSRECKSVNAEEYGKCSQLFMKIREISNFKKIIQPPSSGGCLETFGGLPKLKEIENGFDRIRKLYRTRPVFVCIYSYEELNDIQDYFLAYFRRDYFDETPTESTESSTNGVSKPRGVLAVQSDVHSHTLSITFRFERPLVTQEVKVMDFISYLLEFEGGLKNFLFKNKMATGITSQADDVSLHVFVDLIENGLDNVGAVADIVLAYIQYLHEHWKELNKWIDRHYHDRGLDVDRKSDIDYVEFIAERFKYENTVVDNLLGIADDKVGTVLMSDLIQNKKNISYVISTRDIGKVRAILDNKSAEAPTIETEPFYKTKFIDLPMPDNFETSTVLQQPAYTFEIKETKTDSKIQEKNYTFPAAVNSADDGVYRNLYLNYLRLQSFGLSRICNVKHPGCSAFQTDDRPEHNDFHRDRTVITYDSNECADIETHFKHMVSKKLDDAEFKMVQDYSKTQLSVQIRDPLKFARSLLHTALDNLCLRTKTHPIPTEYDLICGTNCAKYNETIATMNGREDSPQSDKAKCDQAESDKADPFEPKFTINSIDKSERTTVTILFYRLVGEERFYVVGHDEKKVLRVDRIKNYFLHHLQSTFQSVLGVYFVDCRVYKRPDDLCKGIIVEIQSVEDVVEQSGENILKKWEGVMTQRKHLQKLWEENLTNGKIIIQIIGNKKITDEATTAETKNDEATSSAEPEVKRFKRDNDELTPGNETDDDKLTSFDGHFPVWYQKHKKSFDEIASYNELWAAKKTSTKLQ